MHIEFHEWGNWSWATDHTPTRGEYLIMVAITQLCLQLIKNEHTCSCWWKICGETWSGWWFQKFFISIIYVIILPNWLSYFSEGLKPPIRYGSLRWILSLILLLSDVTTTEAWCFANRCRVHGGDETMVVFIGKMNTHDD